MNPKRIAVLLSACLLLLLGGCAVHAQPSLPDLSGMGEVEVIAREEGSGTRAEFETLLKSAEAGTDQIAGSAQEVLELALRNRNAIGYTAFSAIPENSGVTVLSVDGIAPSEDTIRKETYPLCRNYYVAYMGTPSDLGNDFLTYVLGAGQELVAGSCIPVSEPVSFLSDMLSGTLTIQGSTSVAPLMEQLIADYKTYNPNADIQLTATDSTNGLTAAIQGTCDLAMSSRSLKEYENELLETKQIGSDAIAVVVSQDSPLTGLTTSQLKSLYDGDVTSWKDLK